jgi:hypothetical protein
MFWKSALGLLKSGSKPSANGSLPPTITQTVQEAASNLLAKQSKIKAARGAVWLEDLRHLAVADREKVRAYEERVMGGARRQSEDEMGDLIVCDDYRIQKGSPLGTVLPWLAAAVATGIAAWALSGDPEPAPEVPPDTDTQYELGFGE